MNGFNGSQLFRKLNIMPFLFKQNAVIDFDTFPQYSLWLNVSLILMAVILVICLVAFANVRGVNLGPYDHSVGVEGSKATKKYTAVTLVVVTIVTAALATVTFSINANVGEQRTAALQKATSAQLDATLNREQLDYMFRVEFGGKGSPNNIPIGVVNANGVEKSYTFLYTGEGNKYELIEINAK